jgi:hypothetical protein
MLVFDASLSFNAFLDLAGPVSGGDAHLIVHDSEVGNDGDVVFNVSLPCSDFAFGGQNELSRCWVCGIRRESFVADVFVSVA